MLPEKHPTVPNAHSRFEEIINAFVQVIWSSSFVPKKQNGLEKIFMAILQGVQEKL